MGPEATPGPPALGDLLVDVLEERERRYRLEDAPRREPAAEVPRRSLPIMGCLVRLVLFALVLFVLAVVALFILLGGGVLPIVLD